FIGNSFTCYWGGKALIGSEIARSSSQASDRPPIYEQSTENGWDLEQHWNAGRAAARIREGNWDYVVLQEHSDGPLKHREAFFQYSRLFAEQIKKAGAKTILFMTWAR